ncbi:unnamed protein product, partial [Iphiclides podalirius]
MKKLLERVKVLVQEHLPTTRWTRWEVSTATREEVSGEKLEPNVLNKLIFALPTVGLVWAFIPEADRLTEKGYKVQTVRLGVHSGPHSRSGSRGKPHPSLSSTH